MNNISFNTTRRTPDNGDIFVCPPSKATAKLRVLTKQMFDGAFASNYSATIDRILVLFKEPLVNHAQLKGAVASHRIDIRTPCCCDPVAHSWRREHRLALNGTKMGHYLRWLDLWHLPDALTATTSGA
jgi:hypothetical protein